MAFELLHSFPFQLRFISIDESMIVGISNGRWDDAVICIFENMRWTKYDVSFLSNFYHTIAFNKNHQELYIHFLSKQIARYDLKSKEFKYITKYNESINNEYHLFGGSNYKFHLKLKYDAFKQLYDFEGWSFCNLYHALIYIEHKNILYLFGTVMSYSSDKTIWCYSLKDGKWKVLDIKLPAQIRGNFGYCYHAKTRNILIFLQSMDIWIWNIETQKMRKSKIKCNTKLILNQSNVVILSNTKSRIIVSGYIRKMEINLPIDVINIIHEWYEIEEVHLFPQSNESIQHWRIKISDILMNN